MSDIAAIMRELETTIAARPRLAHRPLPRSTRTSTPYVAGRHRDGGGCRIPDCPACEDEAERRAEERAERAAERFTRQERWA